MRNIINEHRGYFQTSTIYEGKDGIHLFQKLDRQVAADGRFADAIAIIDKCKEQLEAVVVMTIGRLPKKMIDEFEEDNVKSLSDLAQLAVQTYIYPDLYFDHSLQIALLGKRI